jgi:uncharacterized membrane protein YhhN
MSLRTLVLAAALAAGLSYIGSWLLPLPPVAAIAWKGAGVGLLALYAALNARTLDGWLLAALLALGALGDVLLETHGFVVGGLAFLAGHLVAVGLYLRNRRPLSFGSLTYAGALFVLIVLSAYLFPMNRATAGPIAVYAAGLGAMAAAAWLSRFPRPLVAAGAIMFAASDLMIFLRTGRPALDIPPMSVAVWGLYFAGQALVAVGVVRGAALDRLALTPR